MSESPFVPLSSYREYPEEEMIQRQAACRDCLRAGTSAVQGAQASMAARKRSLASAPRANGLMMGRSRPEAR